MFKKILLSITLLFNLFNLNAQIKNNIKLGIETGLLRNSSFDRLGFFLNIEPKLKILKNTFIGLRIGATANSHSYENNASLQFSIDEIAGNGVISFVSTLDYYWNENNFRPYLGLGLGYYLLASNINVSRVDIAVSSPNLFEVNVNYQVGFLLRGGVESGKKRFGLEYNFVPKADIEIPNGQRIGTVDNSYLGLSIGFIIGVWKSSKYK